MIDHVHTALSAHHNKCSLISAPPTPTHSSLKKSLTLCSYHRGHIESFLCSKRFLCASVLFDVLLLPFGIFLKFIPIFVSTIKAIPSVLALNSSFYGYTTICLIVHLLICPLIFQVPFLLNSPLFLSS